jgi:hypothetical protein
MGLHDMADMRTVALTVELRIASTIRLATCWRAVSTSGRICLMHGGAIGQEE